MTTLTLPKKRKRRTFMKWRDTRNDIDWRCWSDGNSETRRHYAGEFLVYLMDCDGDVTVWDISLNGEELARGEIYEGIFEGAAMEVAMDAAIACLKAMQANPKAPPLT